jgi:hypothetical protein
MRRVYLPLSLGHTLQGCSRLAWEGKVHLVSRGRSGTRPRRRPGIGCKLIRRYLKDASEDMQLNEGGKRRTCIGNSKSETSEPYQRIFDGVEGIAGGEEEISMLGEKNCRKRSPKERRWEDHKSFV